jgi:hypothetical protein
MPRRLPLLPAVLLFAACMSRGTPVPGPDTSDQGAVELPDLLAPPGEDLGADLRDPCSGGGCPVVELLGTEQGVCAGAKHHVPTLAAGGGGFAVGCLPSGAQNTAPTLKILDGMGREVRAHGLLTMDGYYYKDIQTTFLDGRFQAIYEYNCTDRGTWAVGWGWGCIDFREFGTDGAPLTASLVFGQTGHNGHPVLDWSGASFGVGWVSYDTIFFRRINGDRTLTGARTMNVRVAQDPKRSDDRSAARTKIAWDGSAFGLFVIVGRQLYFARIGPSGEIQVGLQLLGPAFSETFSGQFSAVALMGAYHVAYLDPQAGQVVVLRVGLDGKAVGRTPVISGMYRYPHMIAQGGLLYLFSSDAGNAGQVAVLDPAGRLLRDAVPIAPGRVMNSPVPAYDAARGAGAVAYLDAGGAVKLQRLRLGRP